MRNIYRKMVGWFPIDSEEGVAAVEYALIIGLIAIAIVGTLTTLGTNLGSTFASIASKIPN